MRTASGRGGSVLLLLPLDESVDGRRPCASTRSAGAQRNHAEGALTGIVLAPASQVGLDGLAEFEQLPPHIERDGLKIVALGL